jgi:hypothetical protein
MAAAEDHRGLSPASLPKRGNWFALAICSALLPGHGPKL